MGLELRNGARQAQAGITAMQIGERTKTFSAKDAKGHEEKVFGHEMK
jgi:hypothetical protein